ncbi:MAG TPA: hypothetical protein VGD31_00465 [Sphingobacteriaceae bacterium]
MPVIRPHLLTIGAKSLRTKHIRPRHAPTLLEGYDAAVHLLDPDQPVHPTLILLDLQATEPGFPEFAAPQLAAVLTHRMETGQIHPAWLIGLVPEGIADLTTEAQVAGCQRVLSLPITHQQWQDLLCLVPAPVPSRSPDHATQVYRIAAERVLQAVQAAQITTWTADDVSVLLGYLTRYPVAEVPIAETKRVLRVLGGPEQAYERLRAMVEVWRARFPLYAEILEQFLAGWERREIVHSFVSRDLYEDSRIYACIRKLPERIAQELRLPQASSDLSLD